MALIMITGGARCGKSAVAQRLAWSRLQAGSPVCVAVFGNPGAEDVEFAERIKHHRAERPAEFRTLEAFELDDWLSLVDDHELLLIDCLGTALSAMMARSSEREAVKDTIDLPGSEVTARDFQRLLDRITARPGDTIVVTNESGSGLVPEFESGRVYRDLISRSNRFIADRADISYLCVCGRLLELDMLPREAVWPED